MAAATKRPKSRVGDRKARKARPERDAEMAAVYRALVKGPDGAGIACWGEMPMTYLGEGVYLRSDGSMHSDGFND